MDDNYYLNILAYVVYYHSDDDFVVVYEDEYYHQKKSIVAQAILCHRVFYHDKHRFHVMFELSGYLTNVGEADWIGIDLHYCDYLTQNYYSDSLNAVEMTALNWYHFSILMKEIEIATNLIGRILNERKILRCIETESD